MQEEGQSGARSSRRTEKKLRYEAYLQSDTWKKIRAVVLERDNRVCRSATCSARATVVHHGRYPQILGQERYEWLYALCAPCHDHIHRLTAAGKTLRVATAIVVDGTEPAPRASPGDWKEHRRRSKRAKKKAKQPKVQGGTEPQPKLAKSRKEQRREERARLFKLKTDAEKQRKLRSKFAGNKSTKKRGALAEENERMREIQARARAAREARRRGEACP